MSVEIIANKHFIRKKIISITILFLDLRADDKVEMRVAEKALVIVLNVNYGLLLCKKMRERLPAAIFEKSVLHYLQNELYYTGES